ncbi:MAG TPA: spherulation-specific family 4 protein [Myxococcota bacterium]|nr:spherulation-specific family 4 protein [Myxococcota bacterium]
MSDGLGKRLRLARNVALTTAAAAAIALALGAGACHRTGGGNGDAGADADAGGGADAAAPDAAGTRDAADADGGGAAADAAASADSSAASAATGTIVPLYTDPPDVTWDAVAAAKAAHPTVPVVAILNPANGPGAGADPDYAAGLAALRGAGVVAIGYVFTGYAARPAADVQADVDLWASFYGGELDGIFFDEQSNLPADAPYYGALSAYADGAGLGFTVGNPGTDTDPAYVGTVDVLLIYESAGLPAVAALGGWHTGYDRANFGIIPYAVPALDGAFVAAASPYVGWVYLTDDDLPNPWDSVSSYFAALVAALE